MSRADDPPAGAAPVATGPVALLFARRQRYPRGGLTLGAVK
ncbi:MAG: hypothetical protein ACREE5_02065 [Acetobacteraceae bacterium]